ncbi:hypothetical protein RB653_003362 [Dictyostelium firmibasis]|uniref:O-methyltransferase domain-containing protein n=1 Tax=Dictyostelium firmibasis TaxID=79012 RepID=A0AAN7TXK7_9MYCE
MVRVSVLLKLGEKSLYFYSNIKKVRYQRNKEMMEYSESMELLEKFASGFVLSRMFQTVMRHSICDLLEEGPKHYSDISKEIGFKDEWFCYRLMRYFVPHKLFNESISEVGVFSKTPYSTEFSLNGSLKKLGKFHSNDFHYRLTESLPTSFLNGRSEGPSSLGLSNYWEYFEKNGSHKNIFNDGMIGCTTHISKHLNGRIDLSSFETVVDVGGSHGFFIGSLLDSHPNVKGINFDMECVINSSNEKFQHPRLLHVAGDFFKYVPEADCYLMKNILHDWSDEKCYEILKTISKSMKPNSKIIILDIILNPIKYYKNDLYMDIIMMQLVDAKERSLIEWVELFQSCGFKIEKFESGEIPPTILIISKQ